MLEDREYSRRGEMHTYWMKVSDGGAIVNPSAASLPWPSRRAPRKCSLSLRAPRLCRCCPLYGCLVMRRRPPRRAAPRTASWRPSCVRGYTPSRACHWRCPSCTVPGRDRGERPGAGEGPARHQFCDSADHEPEPRPGHHRRARLCDGRRHPHRRRRLRQDRQAARQEAGLCVYACLCDSQKNARHLPTDRRTLPLGI